MTRKEGQTLERCALIEFYYNLWIAYSSKVLNLYSDSKHTVEGNRLKDIEDLEEKLLNLEV